MAQVSLTKGISLGRIRTSLQVLYDPVQLHGVSMGYKKVPQDNVFNPVLLRAIDAGIAMPNAMSDITVTVMQEI